MAKTPGEKEHNHKTQFRSSAPAPTQDTNSSSRGGTLQMTGSKICIKMSLHNKYVG